jgi:hypothetical protein
MSSPLLLIPARQTKETSHVADMHNYSSSCLVEVALYSLGTSALLVSSCYCALLACHRVGIHSGLRSRCTDTHTKSRCCSLRHYLPPPPESPSPHCHMSRTRVGGSASKVSVTPNFTQPFPSLNSHCSPNLMSKPNGCFNQGNC